ncbi:jg3036 [Pararge aegeria aegeria]|uniref:Jg3036 protein n=1 Tax=Pararge aegeria aegeria TaxID=348720 RepID=A0A8S4QUX1_9NEOP|nr:jg3036 [Pararge aegeria aegeria]
MVSLSKIWETVKEKLVELSYIVLNYLRRLDPVDYVRAASILMACMNSKRELVMTILDFVAHKLGREVVSSITAA